MTRLVVAAYNPLAAIDLNRESPVPLYFQLAQHLEADILSGKLKPGDRLENEIKIAEELGLSRPTVRSAFRYLVEKELVQRRQGHGTVVTAGKVIRAVRLSSLFDDLVETGKCPTTKVLHNEFVRASELVKQALGVADDGLVIYLERLRYGDGEPIALMHNYLPSSLVTLNSELLEEHGFYELLRASRIYPARAVQRISAKNASAMEARLLDERKGAALLTVERTTYDERDVVIEFAQHVYRASRYSLVSTVAASGRSDAREPAGKFARTY